jgi:hypothetical protein
VDGDWRILLRNAEQAEPVVDPGPEGLAELRRIDAFLADRDLPGQIPGWC